ncbi:hypothetical protein BUALT_Bualt06G0134900 [Buddleja alternifolia]|uniref:F-box domain-containing protein n=1 Tax=Buddleja alternifolia TaxID=168488 RepID=A0AAV6XEL2_9LAMI|nr:hypothetical protein BUALT_Bualt06G0134900 [Buddleja alternifolia]
MKLHKTASTSSEVVGSIDDLLNQILLRLPVKSLMRFKLVSKNWQSLITSPCFSLQYNPGRNAAVGLFYPELKSTAFVYIHLNVQVTTKPPFTELNFAVDPDPIWIHHSCNGLLLCCSFVIFDHYRSCERSTIGKCFVYNPTTNCSTKLPRPGIMNGVPMSVCGIYLAFDPANSPSHKVVCVRESEFSTKLRQIEIYSSESDEWRVSGEPFVSRANFHNGVYWNGSIHWINSINAEVLRFNVDEERLGKIPMPGSMWSSFGYFGESCDHLHLILCYDLGPNLIVYEMKRDCSEWFVKYRVDLAEVRAALPEMAYLEYYIKECFHWFSIFSLVRSKKGSAFLVLKVCRKVLQLSLECNTFEEVYTLGDDAIGYPAHQYIESLHMFRGPASC